MHVYVYVCIGVCVCSKKCRVFGINPFLKPFTGHITDQVKSQPLACCPRLHVVRPLPPSVSSHFSERYTVENKRKSAPPEHLLQNWGRFSNYFSKSRRWHDLLWLWWKKLRRSSAKAEGWKYKEETICLLFSLIYFYLSFWGWEGATPRGRWDLSS